MATTPVNRKTYADLDLLLNAHPIRNDIIPLYDLDAIKNSVKNLISTNFYERPFKPFLGSNVYHSLFEPLDRFSRIQLSERIVECLQTNEPRIKNVKVKLYSNEEQYSLTIEISFTIRETNQDTTIDINFFRRIR